MRLAMNDPIVPPNTFLVLLAGNIGLKWLCLTDGVIAHSLSSSRACNSHWKPNNETDEASETQTVLCVAYAYTFDLYVQPVYSDREQCSALRCCCCCCSATEMLTPLFSFYYNHLSQNMITISFCGKLSCQQAYRRTRNTANEEQPPFFFDLLNHVLVCIVLLFEKRTGFSFSAHVRRMDLIPTLALSCRGKPIV